METNSQEQGPQQQQGACAVFQRNSQKRTA